MLQLSARIAQIIRATFRVTSLVSALGRVEEALTERRRRAAIRRELQWLDERTLHDLGLSHRAAAEWPQARRDAW